MRGQGPIDDNPLAPYVEQREEERSYDEIPKPKPEKEEPKTDKDRDPESREDRSSRFG